MIVACPNCETKFNLPEDKIAPGGSKVKCSKCSHVFKVQPPPATPEEEVESLLEEEAPAAPETDASSDFDDAFDEAMAEQQQDEAAEAPDADDDLGLPDMGDDEDLPDSDDLDDLFDESEDEGGDLPTPPSFDDDLPEPGADADDELPDMGADLPEEGEDAEDEGGLPEPGGDLGGDEDEGVLDGTEDDLFSEDDGISEDDLFSEDEEEDETAPAEEPEPEDDDLGLGDSLDLDAAAAASAKKSKKKKKADKGSKLLVTILLLLGFIILLLGGAVYFQAWKWVGVDASSIPFLGQFMAEDAQAPAPGESPDKNVRKIKLVNVLQYYDENEKEGTIFVVQGDAENHFDSPKERIKVKVTLFDAKSRELASQTLLCGNTLSKFQLKVQTRQGIEEGLKSEVGILSNNTFVRPGSSTPFMAVFFDPPEGIAEFEVKAVQAAEPE